MAAEAVHDLKGKRKAKVTEARALLDATEKENRSFTAEEQAQYDGLLGEAEAFTKRIEARERQETFERASLATGEVDANLPHNDPANHRHEYSLVKALREQMYTRESRGKLTGIEAEVHQELTLRRQGTNQRPPEGVLIPWSLGGRSRLPMQGGMSQRQLESRFGLEQRELERRALDTTAGAGSIPTILDTALIDLLRARMVTYGMGARVMSDMQGLFAIPRQNAAATFYMVAESSPVTGSNQTIDQVPFTPHTGGCFTDYSRRFMEQTNQDTEAFVRADLANVEARGVETMALNGLGSSNQPLGLLQNTGITTVAIGTNGGAPTWDKIVEMETGVAVANADMGSLGYVTDAKVRGKLKVTTKVASSTFPIYLWDGGESPLNEYRCGITNLLPSNLTKGTGTNLHTMLFGNWADLVFAFWSGQDVIVDPYTGSSSGTVRIVMLQDFDVNVRHNESFQKMVDIDPT